MAIAFENPFPLMFLFFFFFPHKVVPLRCYTAYREAFHNGKWAAALAQIPNVQSNLMPTTIRESLQNFLQIQIQLH